MPEIPHIDFLVIDIALLSLILLTAIAAVEVRNLLNAAIMMGIYSLLIALAWVNMDAVDVAFTEAAVGAGISTILLVGTIVLVGHHETVRKRVHWPALLAVLITGAVLIYGTLDMPKFGDKEGPVHTHAIAKNFSQQTVPKQSERGLPDHTEENGGQDDHAPDYFHGHVPNQVTSVIVTYRAFDTMFEVAVIFTAGLSMILLLRGRRGNPLKGGLL